MIIERTDSFAMDADMIPVGLAPLINDFEDYRKFVLMRNTYHSAIKEINTKLEILDDEFQMIHDHNPIHHMECRLKSPQSVIEKLDRKGFGVSMNSIGMLTDMAGIRVICNYIHDVYMVADLLLKQDDLKLIRRSDYIKEPKESGYRSLHLVVEVPVFLSERTEYVPVEIQLRTIAMDTWASLEHELKYKREGGITAEIERELINCAEAMALVDQKMEEMHSQL